MSEIGETPVEEIPEDSGDGKILQFDLSKRRPKRPTLHDIREKINTGTEILLDAEGQPTIPKGVTKSRWFKNPAGLSLGARFRDQVVRLVSSIKSLKK